MNYNNSVGNAVAALLVVSLIGCAPNREGAALLAGQGIKISTALSEESAATSAAIRITPDRAIVSTIMLQCEDTNKEACEEAARDYDSAEEYKTFSGLAAQIDLRTKALLSLRDTYSALEAEAGYDARADLQGAVGDLTVSVNGFAGAVGAPLLGPAVAEATNGLAGIFADSSQSERIESANRSIGEALATLHEALKKERQKSADARGLAAGVMQKMLLRLTKAGVIRGYSRTLNSVLEGSGAEAEDASEASLKGNPATNAALTKVMQDRANRAFDDAARNYPALLNGLDALRQAHRDFNSEVPFDLARLAWALDQVSVAVERTRVAEAAAKAADKHH